MINSKTVNSNPIDIIICALNIQGLKKFVGNTEFLRFCSSYDILSQTYNATLFSFDYFYVNVHALSNLFHSINSSFNQASNHVLVLTICFKRAKKQLILSMKGGKKK